MSIIQGTTKVSAGGYNIPQSIRFNDDDSAYLSRTPASAGDRQTWTWSGWVKRGNLGSWKIFFGAWDGTGGNDTTRLDLAFEAADTISITGGVTVFRNSTQVFRDPSAWYHIVVVADTTNATAQNRLRIYVNGIEITNWGTNNTVTQNTSLAINNNASHVIGARGNSPAQYFDGYMAEINFIDGQALDPTSFGEYDSVSGVWIPKAYAGTYGTNGFYITGADSADLGADYSGNGNNFTSSGLTSDDQRGDTPTANHATWNPLFFRRTGSYKPTFADGNLYVAGQGSQVSHTGTTISSTGKHYAEFLVNNGSSSITGPGVVRSYWDGGLAQSYASNYGGSYYADDGTRYYNNTSDSQTAPGANRIGIEVDFANNEVEYFIVTSGGTRTAQGAKLTSSDGIDFDGEGIFSASLHDNSSRNITAYFEADDWWGTPNAGYKALSTANLPEPTIKDGSAYFQTTLFTGTGAELEVNQIENSTFQPDVVWIKQRNKVDNHVLTDAVRGAPKALYPNDTSSELVGTGGITSLDPDGFTLSGDGSVWNNVNQSGITAAAWQWLAGNGTASNTDGTITSTVSANQTAGFSIIGYTGNATSGATIGHGLGIAPAVVITKSRDNGTGRNWAVYHAALGPTKYLELDNTNQANVGSTRWNDTAPSSTVITLGSQQTTNDSGAEMIAYAFAEVEGFSKFGSYTGNGSADGPFVWCGFKPAFVILKNSSAAGYDWQMWDAARSPANVVDDLLRANATTAESIAANLDFTSNGFKLRTSGAGSNGSGNTYIFMAFAEHPFGGSGVAPVPAR